MKKLLFYSFVFLGLSFIPVKNVSSPAKDAPTKKERQYAVKFLKETESDVLDKIKGLSEEQLEFKPAPDRWSVGECLCGFTWPRCHLEWSIVIK
jgi:hypothetical protein